MMDSGADDEIDKGNKSSSSSSSKVSRSYTPLSFYTDSVITHPGPILKGNNVPLSSYNTTVVHQHAHDPMGESKMDIFLSNEETTLVRRNYNNSLSFYFCMDPSVSIPGVRIKYSPLLALPTAVSKSVAAANISFGSQSSKSKVSTNYIPNEAAFSILSKLSIKSLKRFGCVCKSWSILFENKYFMTMYSKYFISRHGSDDGYHTFILANHNGHYEFHLLKNSRLKLNFPYQLQPSSYCTCILGSTSVNGIFCIGKYFPNMMQRSRYTLWNPLTEELVEVPPSPAELRPRQFNDRILMHHIFHGFGYDKLRDDFKVIQYVSFDDMCYGYSYSLPTSFFEIYSLKSNSWRMIHMDKDLRHRDHNFTNSRSFKGLEVYLDGACHWLVLGLIEHSHAFIGFTLLSFDLSDEVFVTTPIGEEEPYYYPCVPRHRLTVLNGSIALISNYHNDVIFQISILGELGVSESWIKLYMYGPLPSIQWPPIGFGKMGYMFINKKDNEVAYVDLSTQIIEEVGIISEGNYFWAGLYKESLQRIK